VLALAAAAAAAAAAASRAAGAAACGRPRWLSCVADLCAALLGVQVLEQLMERQNLSEQQTSEALQVRGAE